jgi:hypothetical protein
MRMRGWWTNITSKAILDDARYYSRLAPTIFTFVSSGATPLGGQPERKPSVK